MSMPKLGNLAPAFTLTDQNGNGISLKNFRGKKYVVLYFYPKAMTPGCTVHSFRHSMLDRIGAVECPKDIVDQIGGWAFVSVGEAYGDGYPLEVLSKWIARACHQDLTKRSDYSV